MKTYKIALLIAICFTIGPIFAQTIPTAPNQRNAEGKRIGEWVITYTKNWKETSIADSIAFYRKIGFDKMGKPQGKTRDYYRSGVLQFEGMMLQIEPKEITDGICFFYHENGQKSKETTFVNGKEEGLVKTWYENGKPQYQYENKNGEIEGLVRTWNEKGDSTKLYFENGKRLDLEVLNQSLTKLYEQNKYIEATEIAQMCVKINKLTRGEEHPDYANSLNNLAFLYKSQGKYSKAEPYYIQALDMMKKVFGEKHPDYATSLNNLADLYKSQGQYRKAEPYYIQALDIIKKVLGEEHPDYAGSLTKLAGLYRRQMQYSKAEAYHLRAIAIRKKKLGQEHPDYATSLNDLAVLYHSQGQFSKAEPFYLQALAIRKKSLGEEHLDYAASLNNLAELYLSQGQYGKAEPYYMKASSIYKKKLGEEHPDYATTLNNLAGLYSSKGQYSKAEGYYLQALDIRKKNLGEEHLDYATSLNNLAELYRSQGQYRKAESYHMKALNIHKKSFGEEHPSYATSLNNLAVLYHGQGQFSNAEPYYIRALAIRKKSLGEEHPDYATSLNNLAELYRSQRQYSKAEFYHLQASSIHKKSLGEEHPDYATSLNNLALLYDSQEQYHKAESYYLQALAIRKKNLGKEHPDYATSLNNLAGLYRSQGQYSKSEPSLLQCIQIEKNNLLTFLETADQAQQEAYISIREYVFKMGHSFGLLAKTPTSAISAYESVLLMKGIQLQNITQLLNYIRQSKDTLLLAQHEQWLALKRSINTQNNQPIAKRVGVVVMQEQADSLYKIMARQSVAFRNFKVAFQITPQAIQKQLKTQDVAIEFVHFQYHNGKRWTDSTYYAALVLRKGWAAPRMVYLCEQRALDSLLNLKGKEERNSQYVERIYGYSNRGIEIDKEKPLRSLYTLLWQPIDSLLTGVSTVYYSPSGLLNRLNIAAIATPTPRQRLLDKYTQLVQLRSTREIVIPQEPITYTQQALLMGGIEYNLDSLAYKRVNASYKQNRGDNSLSLPNSRGGIYNPLYATDEEISNTQNLMQTKKWKADTLKGLRASEEAFQYYTTQKPRVIHLATHGFFLEDTLTRRKRDENLRFDKEPTLLTSSDPMQRSGLVLAGGNHAWQGKTPIPNQADGLLTASEIGAMVLNNTELAVLSACETALGDVKGSEGVFGLQRAFKMAGVKYLLMSLWKVDDEITSKFMTKFYGNWLINKTSVREAYQSTVKQFYKDYPNPYNWAAFVLLE